VASHFRPIMLRLDWSDDSAGVLGGTARGIQRTGWFARCTVAYSGGGMLGIPEAQRHGQQ